MSGGKSCSHSNVLKVKPKQQQLVTDLLLKATLKKSPPKVIGNFDKNFDENFIKKPENQTVDIRLMLSIVVCFAAFVLRLHFCISACSARQGKSPAESTAAQ